MKLIHQNELADSYIVDLIASSLSVVAKPWTAFTIFRQTSFTTHNILSQHTHAGNTFSTTRHCRIKLSPIALQQPPNPQSFQSWTRSTVATSSSQTPSTRPPLTQISRRQISHSSQIIKSLARLRGVLGRCRRFLLMCSSCYPRRTELRLRKQLRKKRVGRTSGSQRKMME